MPSCLRSGLFGGAVALALVAGAQEPSRLVDGMEDPALYTPAQPELGHQWTGEVATDGSDVREGAGCLRFRVHSARASAETYPQWGRSLDPAANDWSPYKALRYWVKVQSDDPKVTHKAMCIVVYNGDSPLQQFVRHVVPVGRWVQLTDNLMTYNRDRVRGLIIYLYETNPVWQDDYTWWVDGLELIAMPGGARNLDGLAVTFKKSAPVAPLRVLRTGDGLALALDARGRIASLEAPGGPLSPPAPKDEAPTGLWLRDWRRGEALTPVEGQLRGGGGGVEQTATLLDGLRVWARYWADGDRLRCRVRVTDRAAEDRPLTLYFALPLAAEGWTWWDDIQSGRVIGTSGELHNNPSHTREPRVSAYPFCALSSGKQAVSLAVPLDPPRLQRMVYNAAFGVLYLAFDFCLSPAATKQKQTAEFEFALFRSDPNWGLRSAAARYYEQYPEYFVRRVPVDGGWGCWGTYAGNPNVPDLGFRYHWGPDPRGGAETMANAVRFDNEQGYLAFPYIEWTNLHVTMEGYEAAGNAEIMERIRFIADPTRTEPLPRWGYAFPYDDQRLGPDYDGWMRSVFQAYLASLIYDTDGNLYGGADKSEFGLLVAKYIPFNADPDIPGGAGEFFLTKWLPAVEKYYADNGVRIDGFGWDNFYVRGQAFDYRREHFAHADAPLAFDPLSLAPVILKDMATYELQKRLVESLRRRNRYLIANQGTISPVPATLALLDIFGYEWNIAATMAYARTMAHHKPVCSLPCAADHYRDPHVRDHLLYGAWPGGYFDTADPDYLALMRRYVPILRRLGAAGWEPVTLARTDDPDVQVERFGGPGGELLFSLKNHADQDRRVIVTVDGSLRPAGTVSATELVGREPVEVLRQEPLQLGLNAPARAVVVVAVGGQ